MTNDPLRIGLDLDGTVYGFPRFFRALIEAMTAAGHSIYCTSNHTLETFVRLDRPRLDQLGIDPGLILSSLLSTEPRPGKPEMCRHKSHKIVMADQVDFCFDDWANLMQSQTETPIFTCPQEKAEDY